MTQPIFIQDNTQLVEQLCKLYPKQAKLIRARRVFVENYCRPRNWNPDKLEIQQILEIRQKGGWKNPPDWRLNGDHGS